MKQLKIENIEFEESFLNYFEDIEDPRRNGGNLRHASAEKIAKPKFKKDISLKGLRKKARWDDDALTTILRQ